MKILFFSDIHAHNYQDFAHYGSGSNSRLEDAVEAVDLIAQEAKARGADAICFGGDLYHLKNFVDSQVIRCMFDAFKRLAEVAPVYMCAGNHDYKSWDKDPVLVEMASGLLGRVFIEQRVTLGDWTLFVFNYRRNISEIADAVANWNPSPKSIGLFHQDVIGAKYGGIEVMKGLDATVLARKFTFTFLGHYHTPCEYQPNVISIGSPLAHNFGDANTSHGFWWLDTDTLKAHFVENTESPQFIDVDFGDQERDLATELPGRGDKDFYRIKLRSRDIPESVRSLTWKRLSFAGTEADQKTRTSISFSDSAEALIQKYVNSKAPADLDKEQLVALGRKYL